MATPPREAQTPAAANAASASSSSAEARTGGATGTGHTQRKAPGWRPQAALAVTAGRATGLAARRLGRGGGTSLPGLIARGLDPRLTRYLAAQLQHGSVVVTGTNGKTTTSGLVAYVLRAAGAPVWRNREGSNLARGVATALLMRAGLSGRLREKGNAAFVFEVDEAAFRQVVSDVQPAVILVTNLFRDQLDRYGEVDIVAERWRESLQTLPPTTTLALNADDPAVAALADVHRGRCSTMALTRRRRWIRTSGLRSSTHAPARAAGSPSAMPSASTATSGTGRVWRVASRARSRM